jgi:mono/diheme cytochrome c family protein
VSDDTAPATTLGGMTTACRGTSARRGWTAAWAGWVSLLAAGHLPAADAPGLSPTAKPADAPRLFATHCGACHGDGATEGSLDLDALLDRRGRRGAVVGGPDHAAWVAVVRNLRAETMPPADEPRPSASDRSAMLRFVERDVFGIDPERPDPGRVVLRRLNRTEYAHTLRDLTGLDVAVADGLPADDTGYGFDTIGDVLTTSPLFVEKAIAAATRVADAVVVAARRPEPGAKERAYPREVRRLFPFGPPPDDDAERDRHLRDTVARLAERAFRRPVDEPTVDRLAGIARAARDTTGGTFEKGVAAALTAAVASPRFLFRVEADGPTAAGAKPGTAVAIDDFALASRLSYFLWSSMPDDELFDLARAGRLRAELPRQVDRLIADPRADRFVSDFVGQWLQTRDVEGLSFDARTVLRDRGKGGGQRTLTPKVRRAMRLETEMLFAHLLRGDLPATDLLTGPRTFLNASLARYYGIADVSGEEMRMVEVEPSSHRGGLLTHASFLAVTSNPTRTSPVKRGLFILANLLGTPSPPPPPDIPPLEAVAGRDAKRNMREMMELHRQDALCASCHARMDPLGLALERYDAVGRWREDADVDTAGRLVTGETFADARELAELIAGPRRRDFHRCLAEKLLTYALGRGVEYFDAPAVDKMVDDAEKNGGGLATLVKGVCRSVPFTMRRADAGGDGETSR